MAETQNKRNGPNTKWVYDPKTIALKKDLNINRFNKINGQKNKRERILRPKLNFKQEWSKALIKQDVY